MKLTINDNDELLDDTGAVIGPVFDSLANRPDIVTVSGLQLAYQARIGALVEARDAALASLLDHQALAAQAEAAARAELATMHAAISAGDMPAAAKSFSRLAAIAHTVAAPVRARALAQLERRKQEAEATLAQIDAERATLKD